MAVLKCPVRGKSFELFANVCMCSVKVSESFCWKQKFIGSQNQGETSLSRSFVKGFSLKMVLEGV